MSFVFCGAVKSWVAEGGTVGQMVGQPRWGSGLLHQARLSSTSHIPPAPAPNPLKPAHPCHRGETEARCVTPTITVGHHQPDGVKVRDPGTVELAQRLLQCEGGLGDFPRQVGT